MTVVTTKMSIIFFIIIIVVVVVVVVVIILVITFMHGIYSYIPETNHVSRIYCVAAVLYIQFVVMVFTREICVALLH
jgi:hypothetical protein